MKLSWIHVGGLALGLISCQSTPSDADAERRAGTSLPASSTARTTPQLFDLGSELVFDANWVEYLLNERGQAHQKLSREDGDRVMEEWRRAQAENRPPRPVDPPVRVMESSKDRLRLDLEQLRALLRDAVPSTAESITPPAGAFCLFVASDGVLTWGTIEQQGLQPNHFLTPAGEGLPAARGSASVDPQTTRRKSIYAAEPFYMPGHPLHGQSYRPDYRGGVLELNEVEGSIARATFRGSRTGSANTRIAALIQPDGSMLLWAQQID